MPDPRLPLFYDSDLQNAIFRAKRQMAADEAARQAAAGRAARGGLGPNPLGSEGTGYIPLAPSLSEASAAAIGTNLGNINPLRALYGQVAESYVPGYGNLSQQESANIGQLLNPGRLIDTERYGAEYGSIRGAPGSPAAISSAVRRTDDEILRRQLLGSQLLGGAAQRGKGILPFENFFVNPQQQYESDWLAKQLAAAPDPAAAFNLNMQAAAAGLRSGMQSGYGGGSRALPYSGGNMISNAPTGNDKVDQVVNKYRPNLAPTGLASDSLAFQAVNESPDWDFTEEGWQRATSPRYTGPTSPLPSFLSPSWAGPTGQPTAPRTDINDPQGSLYWDTGRYLGPDYQMPEPWPMSYDWSQ